MRPILAWTWTLVAHFQFLNLQSAQKESRIYNLKISRKDLNVFF